MTSTLKAAGNSNVYRVKVNKQRVLVCKKAKILIKKMQWTQAALSPILIVQYAYQGEGISTSKIWELFVSRKCDFSEVIRRFTPSEDSLLEIMPVPKDLLLHKLKQRPPPCSAANTK